MLSQIQSEVSLKCFANPQWTPSAQGKEIYLLMKSTLEQHQSMSVEIKEKASNFGVPLPDGVNEFNNIWSEACEFLMAEITLSFHPELRDKVFDIWKYSRASFAELTVAISALRKMMLAFDEMGTFVEFSTSFKLNHTEWLKAAKNLPDYVKALHGN